MDREEKVQFIAETMSDIENVENTESLQHEIRILSDSELNEKFEFAEYLWGK